MLNPNAFSILCNRYVRQENRIDTSQNEENKRNNSEDLFDAS
jgi:hypothetical protein